MILIWLLFVAGMGSSTLRVIVINYVGFEGYVCVLCRSRRGKGKDKVKERKGWTKERIYADSKLLHDFIHRHLIDLIPINIGDGIHHQL